jgi:lysophospholipase L1-like esterase
MKKRKTKKLFIISGIIVGVLLFLVIAFLNYQSVIAGIHRVSWSLKGYPQNKVLLAGSSYIQYWKNSETDLLPVETVNAGVSGTVVSQWIKWVDTQIVPFHPRGLLLYAGSNDINGKENSKKGDVVAAEIEELVYLIHKKLPETEIYYISIAPAPSRWHVWEESKRCNELTKALAERTAYLHFIDCTEALLGSNGGPIEKLFIKDRLHFKPEGYTIWAGIIQPVLAAAFSPSGL